jgi:hypothetical protein
MSPTWPTVVALLFGAGAVVLGVKKKAGWAILPSIIAAIAMFIAYPDMLQPNWLSLPELGTMIVGLLGIIVMLAAFAFKKVPKVLVVFGIVMIMWAAFRLIPSLPPAFANLAPKLGDTGLNLWDTVTSFFKEAFKGK